MPQVSKEQIARAKEIGLEEYVLDREPDNVTRRGKALFLRDRESLEISNGLWNWHSHGIGGRTALDYLIKVRGYGFTDAVRHLAGEDYNIAQPRAAPKAKPPPERKPFVLPPRSGSCERVIAYLLSRGIDRDVVLDCIKRGSLYESASWHNCVFVGYDEQNTAGYASMRGTRGGFKRDITGSDKRFGFRLCPEGYTTAVAVFEAPIDALSHQSLYRDFGGWRLALGGTSMLALTHFIRQHREITQVVVCTDNDEAGNRAADAIRDNLDALGLANCRLLPPEGKDWNEALQIIRNRERNMEDVREDIIFRDSEYKEKFRIKDGESIKITLGYNGEVVTRKCRWIDECHTKIGSEYYHNDEYAEKSAKAGNKTEPAAPEKPQIDILAAKYSEDLQAVTIPMTEAALRSLVGGDYTTELLYGASCKDTYGALVRGKDGIAVCGVGGDNSALTSLHPYWAQTFKRELSPAQRTEPESETLLEEIAEARTLAANRNAAEKAEPG
jgi:hypothetical protein